MDGYKLRSNSIDVLRQVQHERNRSVYSVATSFILRFPKDRRRISHQFLSIGLMMMVWGVLAGCTQPASDLVQGYVEGEYVYVASPYGGALAAPIGTGVAYRSMPAIHSLHWSKHPRRLQGMKRSGS